MDIQFTVTNQNITADRQTTAIGTVNYIRCLFTFASDDWDNTSKYACFKSDSDDTVIAVPLVDNSCYAASNVLADSGTITMSVVGVTSHEDTDDDDNEITVVDYRITSHKIKIAKQKDTMYIGEESAVMEQSEIEAAITSISGYATTATNAKNDAVSAKNDAVSAKNDAVAAKTAAETAQSSAEAKAKLAESYAKGGTGTRSGEDTDNADYYRGQAASSATSAAGSATSAGKSKLDSEAWAVGKRNGTDVESTDPAYNNSAKYWAEQAESSVFGQIDSSMSDSSTHPVRNNVIKSYVDSGLSSKLNKSNVADAYDSTETYSVGDICIHEDSIYKCKTPIATAEAWNSTHWDAKTLDEIIEESIPANVSAFANDAGYLTSHQDISGKANNSIIASGFDPTDTYNVGEYCMHEGALYVCSTAISTAAAWDYTKWTEITISERLSDGDKADKSDLASISETGPMASQAIASGTYFYLDGVLSRAKTNVASGDTFTSGTNYDGVTDGGLNELNSKMDTSALIADGAGAHNSIYRGKNLGTSVTAEQWSAISNGKFTDMFIGDYWEINSVNWRIAHFDYYLNVGNTQVTTHHILIVPDSSLTSAQMNSTNITTGSYMGSDFVTGNNSNTGLATAISAINSAFGSTHILTHSSLMANATSNGQSSGWAWSGRTVDLMSETMVYGTKVWGNAGYDVGSDKTQVALFRLDPSKITTRSGLWLRSVYSAASFASGTNNGDADHYGASYSFGIRPAFAIKAAA